MAMYKIYYMTPEHFGTFIRGKTPTIADIDNTHTFLTTLDFEGGLEDVWVQMQAENWSPNGEARSLIQHKRLQHTSMSVGDVIHNTNTDKWYVVASVGFKELENG